MKNIYRRCSAILLSAILLSANGLAWNATAADEGTTTTTTLATTEAVSVQTTTTTEETTDDSLCYYFDEAVNAGDDDGFVKKSDIKESDNHYGWKLGAFQISGYTRVDSSDSENPIFLKNVGDTVTLSFKLEQDISKLNGKSNLKINNDKKAYDEQFGITKTEFGKGALIIKYTDYENNSGDPQIYTDYLKGLEVGADTEVQLCEEGDYEVALDYSIQSKFAKLVPQEDDYRIYFKFSVRNGNCMVYPFDVATGEELTDTAFTENGFRLDLAKSRYLDIDIKKEVMNEGKDGLTEDTRFNKPARDGEEFTDEGIYTITVSNKYTDQKTEKVIYVGTDSVLQAYVTNQSYTIGDINCLVAEGAVIQDDGTIEMPMTTTTVITTTEVTTVTDISTTTEAEVEPETTAIVKDAKQNALSTLIWIIPVVVGLAVLCTIGIITIVKSKKPKE